jgi:MSHA biogenesis protein MshJ
MLEEILEQVPGLEMMRVESQPPRRLGQLPSDDAGTIASVTTTAPLADAAAIAQAGLRLFRHGLEIEVAGSYPAMLEYVERLEASRWNLLWDRLELEVVKFPKARIRIDLHTISGEEEWIGV